MVRFKTATAKKKSKVKIDDLHQAMVAKDITNGQRISRTGLIKNPEVSTYILSNFKPKVLLFMANFGYIPKVGSTKYDDDYRQVCFIQMLDYVGVENRQLWRWLVAACHSADDHGLLHIILDQLMQMLISRNTFWDIAETGTTQACLEEVARRFIRLVTDLTVQPKHPIDWLAEMLSTEVFMTILKRVEHIMTFSAGTRMELDRADANELLDKLLDVIKHVDGLTGAITFSKYQLNVLVSQLSSLQNKKRNIDEICPIDRLLNQWCTFFAREENNANAPRVNDAGITEPTSPSMTLENKLS